MLVTVASSLPVREGVADGFDGWEPEDPGVAAFIREVGPDMLAVLERNLHSRAFEMATMTAAARLGGR